MHASDGWINSLCKWCSSHKDALRVVNPLSSKDLVVVVDFHRFTDCHPEAIFDLNNCRDFICDLLSLLMGKTTGNSSPCNVQHDTLPHCHSQLSDLSTLWFKKNAPTLADYNYDPVQSILIIFSKLFVNDNKRCLVVKFSTSPHICCHYTLWNTMLYFALITLLIARNAPTSDHHITSISVKEF